MREEALDRRHVLEGVGDVGAERDDERRAGRGAGIVLVLDDATLARFGVGRNAAMRQLHAVDEAGTWHIGVPAFLAIWKRIPRYRWAAMLVRALRLTRPMQWLYARWAQRRFTRLCRAGRCSTGESA